MARVVAVLALLVAAGVAVAQSTETVGMITEIKTGRGRVEVRSAGDWRRAGPLQALRAGDAVRVTDDAMAVVMLTGGGTVKIEGTNSPYTVAARTDDTRTQKARTLVQAGLGFLAAGQRDAPTAVLSTRSSAKPPIVIAPRNTSLLPGPLALEWTGSRFARYTVRIVGPSGPVFERRGVAGGRLDYPPDAPPLAPSTRYTIQVASGDQAPQEAWFEVLDTERARKIADDLTALTQSFGGSASRNSVAVVRAGMLASAGLLHDARRVVLDALASDPDEPALHQALGNVYQKSGLGELAAESYDEAQFLLTRNAK
jgi:hypothetical protein